MFNLEMYQRMLRRQRPPLPLFAAAAALAVRTALSQPCSVRYLVRTTALYAYLPFFLTILYTFPVLFLFVG